MRKILYTMMGVGMLFAATSCEDFLDTSSPSEADVDFVFSEASTARAALYNAYEKWRGNAGVHSNGVFYDLVVCGSDAERHPEAYASQIARHVPENLYGYSDATFTKKGPSNYTISLYGNAKGTWESLYAIIATTNTLISAVSRKIANGCIGDFILSLIALVVFSPLFLICYIAIRREDGGSAIFKQERIGRFGRPFYIYKFRSMCLDAEKLGPQLSHSGGDNDPRLTKTGRFIRAHHLDGLPRLYNVLRGDMAFIGPRPERKFYIDQILEHDARYTYLYQIRPGVTSYATLYNGYTDTMEKMLRRLEYDLYYLGHRSWLFDFKILLNTFCSIVFGKKF